MGSGNMAVVDANWEHSELWVRRARLHGVLAPEVIDGCVAQHWAVREKVEALCDSNLISTPTMTNPCRSSHWWLRGACVQNALGLPPVVAEPVRDARVLEKAGMVLAERRGRGAVRIVVRGDQYDGVVEAR